MLVKFKRVVALVVFLFAVCSMLTPGIRTNSEELTSSQKTEKQLDEIINTYGEENIIFDDGFSLYVCSMLTPGIRTNSEELTSSQKTEKQLDEIINTYGEENIIFDDGFSLYVGEEIELPSSTEEGIAIEFISNDSSIFEIVNNRVVAKGEGVTFLISKVDSNYHVTQVYVAEEPISTFAIEESVDKRAGRDQYVVYVDAGHGGKDPGTIANGINEKDLNLSIALKVRNKLQQKGVQVVMNRETDVFVDFKDTAKHANSVNSDVFVSIHNNSATATSANGLETFYTKQIDLPYGKEIHSRLIANTGAYDRGLKPDTYYVTNHTVMPAVLVESGFITNPTEASKLKTDAYQEKIASAIVDGIMEYLTKNVTINQTPAERISGITNPTEASKLKTDAYQEKIASAIVDGIMEYLTKNVTINQTPAERISGSSRYETAVEIFNKGWQSADTAILVTGKNYPDALSATPLAAKYDAPILLADNASLKYQPELSNALKNKSVKNVIIIGSEGIIPKVIESELANMGITSRRIAGNDRYETSLAIAKEVGINSGEIVVASGQNFPDGLSIASIAAKKQMPILLIREQHIPGNTKAYMDSANITKTYLLGSEGLIPNSVANQLKNVERLAGKDRYETNEKIFNKFKNELNLDHLYIASALDFPDALATSALAAKTNSFVVLSYPTYPAASLRAIVNSSRGTLDKVYVIGSKGLIPDDTFTSAGIGIIK